MKAQRRKKNKIETEHKTDPEMGECNYSKTHEPFHVEGKVDINPYTMEVDSIRLNQLL